MSETDKKEPENSAPLVRCPGCGKPTPYSTGNQYRPFCSPPCYSTDLISWASEDYKIPGPSARASADRQEHLT